MLSRAWRVSDGLRPTHALAERIALCLIERLEKPPNFFLGEFCLHVVDGFVFSRGYGWFIRTHTESFVLYVCRWCDRSHISLHLLITKSIKNDLEALGRWDYESSGFFRYGLRTR